jgi:uncharacterized coiled-coil DUF342 family protein
MSRGGVIINRALNGPAGDGGEDDDGIVLPATWQEGLAQISDVFRAAIEEQDARHQRELKAARAEVDDLRGICAQLADRVTGERSAALAEVRDEFAGQLRAQVAVVDELRAEVNSYAEAVDEMRGALRSDIEQLQTAAVELTAHFKAADMVTGARLGELAGDVERVGQIAATAVTGIDGMREQLKAVDQRVTTVVQQTTEAIEAINVATLERIEAGERVVQDLAQANAAELVALGTRVDEVTAAASEQVEHAREIVATVDGAHTAARTALAETRTALAVIPRTWIVDQAGALRFVDGNGELVTVGTVVGRDGVDGKDAPRIVAAKVEGGKLVLVRGDGSDVSCELPAAGPAPAVAVRPEPAGNSSGEPDPAEIVKRRDKGAKFADIAGDLRIVDAKGNPDPRKASRLYHKAKRDDHKGKGKSAGSGRRRAVVPHEKQGQ